MYRQSEKKLVKHRYLIHNMVNFGLLTAEICWRVWVTPANFNGFRVLAALLHGTVVVGVSQTAALNRGATCSRQGGHHAHISSSILIALPSTMTYALCRNKAVIMVTCCSRLSVPRHQTADCARDLGRGCDNSTLARCC